MKVTEFDIHERIKYLREEILKIKQSEMSLALNLKQGSLSDIERKKTKNVTDRVINDICREFDVNEEWLRTGEGDMFVQSDTFSLNEYAQKNQLTELELDIIKGYMNLNKDVREAILSTAKELFAKHSETAASLEPLTPEQIAAEEAESYRLEILAELKTKTSSASDELNKKESS